MSVRRFGRLWFVGVLCVCGSGLVLLGVPSSVLAAAAPVVKEEWVGDVHATSATLYAEVNPGGAATTYRFEYATSEAALLAGQGVSVPTPPSEGDAGEGEEGVLAEVHPKALAAHTHYWYRVVVKNEQGETLGCQTEGACGSFTTQAAGDELVLPDGRAWELVSPPTKDGANIVPPEQDGSLVQAAEAGGAITYASIGAIENPVGNSNLTQAVSVRSAAGGWSSQNIATPHEVATGVSQSGQEYRFFSSDLSTALVEPFGSGSSGSEPEGAALLSPGASEMTLYLRANTPLPPTPSEQGDYTGAMTEGGYLPLVTGCPLPPTACRTANVEKDANVPAGTSFGGHLSFVGATSDLSHMVFDTDVPLTAETPEGKPSTEGGLYEWAGGRLQLVSILPDSEQEQPAGEASLGEKNGRNVRGAISSDGSRVVWSANGHLYMRDVSTEKTVQLDLFQGGSGPSLTALFQFANAEGTKVFFTDDARLTANSSAVEGRPDLYECEIVEVNGELECKLQDLTIDPHYNETTNPRENADVKGTVIVGSDNSSFIYFVGEGELTEAPNAQGEKAKAGKGKRREALQNNLYMLHYNEENKEWEPPVFVAGLSEEDSPDWEGLPGDLEMMTSRVAPNGKYLAFMSERSLTGYDNTDVNSGQRDEEVYLYSAETGRLACASCNPTGERPAGIFDSGSRLVDEPGIWTFGNGRWLAGNIPGWTAMHLNYARYQSRYLSNDGRVFFNSSDALVPQDTNGLMDVYEYEPEGVPANGPHACTASSATFSASTRGCIGLVSSGSSDEESAFLDASGRGPGGEEGEDVFFLTSARLALRDRDTSIDVYDAHVCSTVAPCSTEVVSPPPCTTADSCRAAPVAQPSIFGAPSSATFSGAGNVAAPAPARTAKPKVRPLTRAQKLAVALRACRKIPKGAKRAHCEVRARNRYGAVRARKSVNADRRAK